MNLSDTQLFSGSHPTARPWLPHIPAFFRNIVDHAKRRRLRAQELRELYRCTDRELWDLGLSRSDFLAIEKGVYRRD